jgi:outer membrane protein assembly factor BamA
VHDNALFGYVGPFAGARSRFQVSPSVGDWQFVTGLADWRRYLFARPFTLALRGVFFGRYGRDANSFRTFLGNTELMRGYTAGSLIDNECTDSASMGGVTGCSDLDQLIGSKVAVANIELRFPLTRSVVLGFLPVGLPPIEGALFYDVGLAWDSGSTIKWRRDPGDDPERVRQPVRSWGGSIRANLLGFVILRLDYTKPLDRGHGNPYWTVSLGPTF